MANATPIHELPAEVRGMAYAWVHGDSDQAMAILMLLYEKKSTRSIEAATGVPATTVRRLAKGFREICQSWLDRRDQSLPAEAA